MSSYDIVIDSSTRKDISTTDANSFTSYLSTPLYGVQSLSFVSASVPYINGTSAVVNGNVHAYYVVLEVPNYGILTDRIYTVENPPEGGDTNLNFAYTGSLIVPALAGLTIPGLSHATPRNSKKGSIMRDRRPAGFPDTTRARGRIAVGLCNTEKTPRAFGTLWEIGDC